MYPYNNMPKAIERLQLNDDVVTGLLKLASALDGAGLEQPHEKASVSAFRSEIPQRFMTVSCMVLGIPEPEFYSGVWEKFPMPPDTNMPGHVIRVAIINAASLEPA